MQDFIIWTLAQEDAPPSPPEAPVTPQGPAGSPSAPGQSVTQQPGGVGNGEPPSQAPNPFGFGQLFFFVLLFGLIWFVLMSGQRREGKRLAAMLAKLKKGDKVITAGGIIGNIVEVRDNEVILKVDENNNTRIRILPSKIQSVIEEKGD